MVDFDYEELEVATENFSPSRLIGKGSHGSVYKGILKDGKLVAVKKQSLGLQKLQDNLKLDDEIRILSSLPRNPYLITFLGTSHDYAKNKVLVMEHMPNGTLHDLLHVSPSPPPWTKRIQVALQIARAVQFLHQANPLVIHRDIKSANILFDSNWRVKLADFGLAVTQPEEDGQRVNSLRRPAGTIGYLDPCYTTPCKLSTKNDVFSFGVVLLEIISGTKAIDVSRVPASIVEWALPLIEEHRVVEIFDKRVVLPVGMEGIIRHMLLIAARCVAWKENYNRPSMGEIVTEVEKYFVERVPFSIWINILRNVLKRRPKNNIATSTTTIIANGHSGELSRGKMLLREVLADTLH